MGKVNLFLYLESTTCFIKHLPKYLLRGLTFPLGTTTLRVRKGPEDKADRKLGTQAYLFRLFLLAEALRKIDSCGLKYVEAFPGSQSAVEQKKNGLHYERCYRS